MSQFFRSGSKQSRNLGAPGSFDCISSSIFSTLTRGGARRYFWFSSKTSKGSSTAWKKNCICSQGKYVKQPKHVNKMWREHTTPFASPTFFRSLIRPCISQRAEKLTTAHCTILHGSANFCPNIEVLLRNTPTKFWISYKENNDKQLALLLKFHRPLRTNKSSPLPTLSCIASTG